MRPKPLLCSLEHFLSVILKCSAVWVADNKLKVGAGRGLFCTWQNRKEGIFEEPSEKERKNKTHCACIVVKCNVKHIWSDWERKQVFKSVYLHPTNQEARVS